MKLQHTPAGYTIQANGHLSDAILQAWTWRFFRKHAASLGGDAWRKEPTFKTKSGATAWVETVEAWFAIVHPGSGFSPVSDETANGFANMSQAILGSYGVSITSPDGEDLGWTPITYSPKSKGWRREGWDWQDGLYGLAYYFDEQAPDEGFNEDALAEWTEEHIAPIVDEIFQSLTKGIVAGTTQQGFGWRFLSSASYPEKI